MPASIKELLGRAVEGLTAKQQSPVYEEEIKRAWEDAVGKDAGRHSAPARFKGKTLIINVDSPIWIYQLNIKKTEIEQKLNKAIKEKAPFKISFRAGES